MTCREFTEFLADYLAGELPESQHTAFAAHLASCPACATYMKSYAQTVRLAKTAYAEPDDPVPDDAPDELAQAILAARRPK